MDEKPYQLLGEAREHRTAVDWAGEIRYLVDAGYPDCDKIILVMDNLNTHALSSLYKAFPGFGNPQDCQKAGNPLHPEAWKLAGHRRNRA
ncbi:MAG: hypothetical protein HFH89_09890 [Lachnospiraceae bacterium]|nr:hypothetical protein [uncultured Acetatifactor sp.]MCI8287946.1 hypothetical protein [Lachnospiraceae bacterium]MCI9362585.1 hypothetical protein [Hungatella sp.]